MDGSRYDPKARSPSLFHLTCSMAIRSLVQLLRLSPYPRYHFDHLFFDTPTPYPACASPHPLILRVVTSQGEICAQHAQMQCSHPHESPLFSVCVHTPEPQRLDPLPSFLSSLSRSDNLRLGSFPRVDPWLYMQSSYAFLTWQPRRCDPICMSFAQPAIPTCPRHGNRGQAICRKFTLSGRCKKKFENLKGKLSFVLLLAVLAEAVFRSLNATALTHLHILRRL